jgi:hypothetical protein
MRFGGYGLVVEADLCFFLGVSNFGVCFSAVV